MRLTQTIAEQIRAMLAQQSPPIFVAICGWADTGKSSLAKGLCTELRALGVDADWISTDAFLKDRAERNAMGITGYSDLALDSALLVSAIEQVAQGEAFLYQPYDNRSGTKHEGSRIVPPRQVLVVEGIHALHAGIEKRFVLKMFIDSDESTLLEMRRRANILKRGMNPGDAVARIQREWEDFCSMILPQKRLANLVIGVNQDYEYSHPINLCSQSTHNGASSMSSEKPPASAVPPEVLRYIKEPVVESKQFDFLIGEWDVDAVRYKEDGTPLIEYKAKWTAIHLNGGRMVMDDFKALGPTGEPISSFVTLRTYSETNNRWELAGLQALQASTPLEWHGIAKGDEMLLDATAKLPTGDSMLTRIRFFNIASSSFSWESSSSHDQGASWRKTADLTATRAQNK